MKVLMVDYYLPESLYIVELAGPMTEHADVHIFCKQTAAADIAPGVQLIPGYYEGGNKLKAVLHYGYSLLRLKETILKGGFDVVHVSSFKKAKAELMLYTWLRPRIKKLVHTVHNVLPHESKQKDIKLWGDFYAICDELIVHNEVSKQILLQTFQIPESKVHVIAHGAYNSYPISNEITFQKDRFIRFTMFGLIRKYKGVDILLKAIAALDEETRSRTRFTIVGHQFTKYDDTDYNGMIQSLGIEGCVRFVPERVDDSEVPKLYSETDIALFPYRMIYGSGSLLMAYTFRKPVIVSAIPALLEETENGKTGLSFRSEDSDDLARAITQAANWTKTEYAEFAENIAELTEDKYNWKVSAKKTFDVYCKP